MRTEQLLGARSLLRRNVLEEDRTAARDFAPRRAVIRDVRKWVDPIFCILPELKIMKD